jgi:hypothetical protein
VKVEVLVISDPLLRPTYLSTFEARKTELSDFSTLMPFESLASKDELLAKKQGVREHDSLNPLESSSFYLMLKKIIGLVYSI